MSAPAERGVGTSDHGVVPEVAERARTLDGGAHSTPTPRLDASDDGEPRPSEPPVDSHAGGGAGDGLGTSQASEDQPDAAPGVLESFAACAIVHALSCEILADPKHFGRCLSHDAISKLCYYAWRICDRLERELGLCPCRRRNPRVPGSHCTRCGWTFPRTPGASPRAERKPAPGGAGEVLS